MPRTRVQTRRRFWAEMELREFQHHGQFQPELLNQAESCSVC